nr:2704_t:CDS:10 [Entrophospora candida]
MSRDNLSMVKNPFMFLFWSIKDQHNYKLFLKIIGKFEKKRSTNIEIKLNLEELLDYNNPLASSIIYTSEQWLKDSLENFEQKLSNVSNCAINNYRSLISRQDMKELVNHFKCLRKNHEYLEEDCELNEGTWEAHCVTIPFNIASRNITQLKLIISEKASRSLKRRRNEIHSDDEQENNVMGKKRKKQGKCHDMRLESRKPVDSNLKFEFLVGEVCFQPWCKKEDKTDDDTKKLFRIMKDCYDSIVLYFYNKFSVNYSNHYNLRNLEIYGFELTIYVLDHPGFGAYRIQKAAQLNIPAKEENDNYYFYINKSMFAIDKMSKLVKNLNSELEQKSSKKNEKDFLVSSLKELILVTVVTKNSSPSDEEMSKYFPTSPILKTVKNQGIQGILLAIQGKGNELQSIKQEINQQAQEIQQLKQELYLANKSLPALPRKKNKLQRITKKICEKIHLKEKPEKIVGVKPKEAKPIHTNSLLLNLFLTS